MKWVSTPSGGRIDIDAFVSYSRKDFDKMFPYYNEENRDWIWNAMHEKDDNTPIQAKSPGNKRKPDPVD